MKKHDSADYGDDCRQDGGYDEDKDDDVDLKRKTPPWSSERTH